MLFKYPNFKEHFLVLNIKKYFAVIFNEQIGVYYTNEQ